MAHMMQLLALDVNGGSYDSFVVAHARARSRTQNFLPGGVTSVAGKCMSGITPPRVAFRDGSSRAIYSYHRLNRRAAHAHGAFGLVMAAHASPPAGAGFRLATYDSTARGTIWAMS